MTNVVEFLDESLDECLNKFQMESMTALQEVLFKEFLEYPLQELLYYFMVKSSIELQEKFLEETRE